MGSRRAVRLEPALAPVSPRASFRTTLPNQNGSVLAELAIILPVIFLLVGGVFVFGVRLSDAMYLNQTAREIAIRLGTIPWIAEIGPGTHTYSIDPAGGPPAYESSANACLQTFTDIYTPYEGCGTTGCNAGCIDTLVQWFAYDFVRARKLFVTYPIQVTFSFGPAGSDPTESTGICFVRVGINASYTNMLFNLNGGISANAMVAYVSNPAPDKDSSCSTIPYPTPTPTPTPTSTPEP